MFMYLVDNAINRNKCQKKNNFPRFKFTPFFIGKFIHNKIKLDEGILLLSFELKKKKGRYHVLLLIRLTDVVLNCLF